jgi:hypothetical protein
VSRATSCVICFGAYYTDCPHSFAASRSLTAARRWLRARGYTQRKAVREELAYAEHDEDQVWARVVAAPLIGENNQ